MVSPWVLQTCIAILFLTPAWLAMPFFANKFGVSGAVFAVWYFAGTAISIAIFAVPTGKLVPSYGVVGALVVLGLTIGGVANAYLFNAVSAAPNPGLPVALGNLTGLTTLIAALVLARVMPQHFTADPVSVRAFIGVVLIIIGAACIAVK